MTGRIHDKACLQRLDKPVARGLPLHLDARRSLQALPQFSQDEGLGLAPAQILLCRIGISQRIDTCARRSGALFVQQCARAWGNAGRPPFTPGSPVTKSCSLERERASDCAYPLRAAMLLAAPAPPH